MALRVKRSTLPAVSTVSVRTGSTRCDQPVAEAVGAHAGDAARRQPAELDREQQNQQQRQPERWHRDAGEGQQVEAVVEPGARPERGHDAGRQRDDQGEQEAHAHEQAGVAETGQQHLEHRSRLQARIAEIALQRGAEPVAVALEQRSIEAVHLLEPGDVRRRDVRIAARHQIDRIARHQADQAVDHERHQQQDDQPPRSRRRIR